MQFQPLGYDTILQFSSFVRIILISLFTCSVDWLGVSMVYYWENIFHFIDWWFLSWIPERGTKFILELVLAAPKNIVFVSLKVKEYRPRQDVERYKQLICKTQYMNTICVSACWAMTSDYDHVLYKLLLMTCLSIYYL